VVPLVALAAGAGAGWLLDRALPHAVGAGAWGLLALVGGAASAVAAAVGLGTRYVEADELGRLARLRPE
jgi:hypothetical protein